MLSLLSSTPNKCKLPGSHSDPQGLVLEVTDLDKVTTKFLQQSVLMKMDFTGTHIRLGDQTVGRLLRPWHHSAHVQMMGRMQHHDVCAIQMPGDAVTFMGAYKRCSSTCPLSFWWQMDTIPGRQIIQG